VPRPRERGHRGIAGNEAADGMARKTGWVGAWMSQPEIATPAGIQQAFPLYSRPAHPKWDREALWGLVYITDRGP